MQDAPRDYNICECCGTEFGNDDDALSHGDLRAEWIEKGTMWFYRTPPVGWNPWVQLLAAYVGQLPYDGAVTYYGSSAPGVQKIFCAKNLDVENDDLARAA